VVSAGQKQPSLLTQVRSLGACTQTTNGGRQVIAQNSGHFVQWDEPQVVLEAIQEVLARVRET